MFSNIKNFFDTAKNIENNDQEFLDEDIYAVLSILIEASKVDGVVNDSEIELIKNILVNKFHLHFSKAEKATKFVLDKSNENVEIYSEIKIILNNMDHNQRIAVIEMMWKIILADGKIDDYESNLIRRVCGLLHISGIESSEAKKRALA